MTVSGHCSNRALKVYLPEGRRTSCHQQLWPLHSDQGTLAVGISSNSMCLEKTKEARATDSPKTRRSTSCLLGLGQGHFQAQGRGVVGIA